MKSERDKGKIGGLIMVAIWLSVVFVFCILRYSHATIAIPAMVGIVWSLSEVATILCK